VIWEVRIRESDSGLGDVRRIQLGDVRGIGGCAGNLRGISSTFGGE
jgi:hypothetical protein